MEKVCFLRSAAQLNMNEVPCSAALVFVATPAQMKQEITDINLIMSIIDSALTDNLEKKQLMRSPERKNESAGWKQNCMQTKM